MSKTTYTAGVDLFLVDGEIYIVDLKSLIKLKTEYSYQEPQIQEYILGNNVKRHYILNGNLGFIITHSTKQIEGVHLLERNRFVKGEVLEEMIDKSCELSYFDSRESMMYSYGFKAGYKANKNEFTREEMVTAICNAVFKTSSGKFVDIDQYIASLRPLSLPLSVTIENNEIIEVKWN